MEWVARAEPREGGRYEWRAEWACDGCARGVGRGVAADRQQAREEQVRAGAWAPPSRVVAQERNSWLYVPFLLDAAGFLAEADGRRWREHPLAAEWWDGAVATLRAASPVGAGALAEALGLLAQTDEGAYQAWERISGFGGGVGVGVREAVRALGGRDGYVQPLVQDVLLQQYGGLDLARSLDARSQRFRDRQAPIAAAPPGTVEPPPRPRESAGEPPPQIPSCQAGVATGSGAPAQQAAGGMFGVGDATSAVMPGLLEGPRSTRRGATGNSAGAEEEDPQRGNDGNSSDGGLSGIMAALEREEERRQSEAEQAARRSERGEQRPGRGSGPARARRGVRVLGDLTAAARAEAWAGLEAVDLARVFKTRARVIQGVPRSFRGRLRECFLLPLRALEEAYGEGGDEERRSRAWKLFLLTSRMLLHKADGEQSIEKTIFADRADRFLRGDWLSLLADAGAACMGGGQGRTEVGALEEEQRTYERACAFVRLGEASRGRAVLTSSALAPGSAATLAELRDPERRPQRQRQALPEEVVSFHPQAAVQLQPQRLIDNLRGARRGSAGGPSGITAEHLQVLLDDEVATGRFVNAAEQVARADLPGDVVEALLLGRLTALRKPNGKVRGIVTGDAVRRLVGRTLAQQHSRAFDAACAPFQFALSTRAGTDAVAHMLRAATDASWQRTVVSVDGVGAFDHILRSQMLGGLASNPDLAPLLPFARMAYGRMSTYVWYDDEGTCHEVQQAEGGEQGDPLMPALFALGQHPALRAASAQLRHDEELLAYLDDLYVVCDPQRARTVFEIIKTALAEHAGIDVNLGKCRIYNHGGVATEEVRELDRQRERQGAPLRPDDRVWVGDAALPAEHRGVVVLGSPIGTPEFVQKSCADRLSDQQDLLRKLGELPDLQCAWVLLMYCASPRCVHTLRTVPPALAGTYAEESDAAVQSCLWQLLGNPGGPEATIGRARAILSLPARMGGLGLRSAVRMAPAAYWASWADALPAIQARQPGAAGELLGRLLGPPGACASLDEAERCRRAVEEAGGEGCPGWAELVAGARASAADEDEREPGEFSHGWQYRAALALETLFRESVLMPSLDPAARALLRSQSGRGAAQVLMTMPTSPETTIKAERFRTILLRRLRLPLPLGPRRCRCLRALDAEGDHRAGCATAGRLLARGTPLEQALARVCREAGARVATNAFLRDLNVAGVRAGDGRRIEVIANGLPLWGGVQLAVDATIVSPIQRDGAPKPRAADCDGISLARARKKKEDTYPELLGEGRCRLVVFACEVGGRWSEEAQTFLRLLANAKARATPQALRRSAAAAYMRRWASMLAVAAQSATAASLVEESLTGLCAQDGEEPMLHEVICGGAGDPSPVDCSRMPARP